MKCLKNLKLLFTLKFTRVKKKLAVDWSQLCYFRMFPPWLCTSFEECVACYGWGREEEGGRGRGGGEGRGGSNGGGMDVRREMSAILTRLDLVHFCNTRWRLFQLILSKIDDKTKLFYSILNYVYMLFFLNKFYLKRHMIMFLSHRW